MPIQAKAALVFMIANFCNMGFNFLATPFFTRLMPETEIGIVSVFDTWRNILSVVVTLNLSYGIYEVYLAKHKEDKGRMTQSLISVTTVLCLLFTLAIVIFRDFFTKLFDLNYEYLLILCFEIYSMAVVNFWMTQKRFEYDYRIYGVVIVSVNFLKAAVSLIAVVLFPQARIIAKLLGWAIPYYVLAVVLLINHIRHWEGLNVRKYSFPAMKYNIVLIPHYLANILLGSADKVIISRIVGEGPTGIYSISSACASAVSVVLSSINTAFTPYVYQKLNTNQYEDIYKISKVVNVIAMGICTAATLVGPELFKIFAPLSYYDGIVLLPALIAGVYMTSLYAFFSNIEFYYHYNKLTSAATLVGGIVNIATNFWLIPIFGYKAAAYTTLGSYVIMSGMHMVSYVYIARKEKIKTFDLRFLIISSIIYTLFSIGVTMIYDYHVIRWVLFICVIAIIALNRKRLMLAVKEIRN